jgi:hypothetical protein
MYLIFNKSLTHTIFVLLCKNIKHNLLDLCKGLSQFSFINISMQDTVKIFLIIACFYAISCKSVSQTSSKPSIVPADNITEIIIDSLNNITDAGAKFNIDTAYVTGNVLAISVSYSGGCKEHSFSLSTNKGVMKSLPPKMNLILHHKNNSDHCETLIHSTFSYDITKTRISNSKKLILNINDYQYPIEYNY